MVYFFISTGGSEIHQHLAQKFIDIHRLHWILVLLIMGLSGFVMWLLLNVKSLYFALTSLSSILIISLILYLGIDILGISENTNTGIVSTIAIVIGTIVVLKLSYDDTDPENFLDCRVFNFIIRIVSSLILGFAGYIYGGLFLPTFLGMYDKVEYGMYNVMGLPIGLGLFMVSFLAFYIMDQIEEYIYCY